jgi:hypothetical protein
MLGGSNGAGLAAAVPVLVDGMGDEFLEAYSAWPLRFYALVPDDNASASAPAPAQADTSNLGTAKRTTGGWRMAFKAQPHKDDLTYHFSDLEDWVAEHIDGCA